VLARRHTFFAVQHPLNVSNAFAATREVEYQPHGFGGGGLNFWFDERGIVSTSDHIGNVAVNGFTCGQAKFTDHNINALSFKANG
jgi:hypothetical protein